MNANDPRLTAQALGEADAESAEIISLDPALLAEAGRIEQFAAELRTELHDEVMPSLRPEQRAAILAAANIASGPAHWWQRGPAIAAAAASIALALGAAIYFQAQHVSSLRPVATAQKAAPAGVNVRWNGESGMIHLEPVLAPKAAVDAHPSYPAPTTEIVRTGEPAKLPDAKASVENVPTLVAGATPAPVKVDPATVPMNGTFPAETGRVNASPLRLGTQAPRGR